VDCDRKIFPESECVEWILGFRNTGTAETALLSEPRSMDITLSPPANGGNVIIHAMRGCGNGDKPFALERVVSERGMIWRIGNPGGGMTGSFLPFFNLDFGGRGLFCGLGKAMAMQIAMSLAYKRRWAQIHYCHTKKDISMKELFEEVGTTAERLMARAM